MLDREALIAACATRKRVARVVVAEVAGSAPREAGTEMLVWQDGQSGTIGGGALEWEALARARQMLAAAEADCGPAEEAPPRAGVEDCRPAVPDCPAVPRRFAAEGWGGTTLPPGPSPAVSRPAPIRRAGPAPRIDRMPLGPALGQCCGGAVVLVTEVFDSASAAELAREVHARGLDGREMPLAIRRLLDRARGQGFVPCVTLDQGWLVEPVARKRRPLWVWGAGHVGRAVVDVVAPLPDFAVTWLDVSRDRFPDLPPEGVALRCAAQPEAMVAEAPAEAEHLVLTFSHALDLALCHRLLSHGFAGCGLIGSQTKWARFRSRLAALGHPPEAVARIRCPIGMPALGKHPQAIAISVAAELLATPPVRTRKGLTA